MKMSACFVIGNKIRRDRTMSDMKAVLCTLKHAFNFIVKYRIWDKNSLQLCSTWLIHICY